MPELTFLTCTMCGQLAVRIAGQDVRAGSDPNRCPCCPVGVLAAADEQPELDVPAAALEPAPDVDDEPQPDEPEPDLAIEPESDA